MPDLLLICEQCGYESDETELQHYPELARRGEGPILCEACREEWEDEARLAEIEDRDDLIDGVGFAEPGGRSALRAATPDNPRNMPCPTCGEPDCLTPLDVARHYQCDRCADLAESGGY